MRIYETYKCPTCNEEKPVAEILLPPKDGKPAESVPCEVCGPVVWVPVKK
jgi:transcription elongation factor Elf1